MGQGTAAAGLPRPWTEQNSTGSVLATDLRCKIGKPSGMLATICWFVCLLQPSGVPSRTLQLHPIQLHTTLALVRLGDQDEAPVRLGSQTASGCGLKRAAPWCHVLERQKLTTPFYTILVCLPGRPQRNVCGDGQLIPMTIPSRFGTFPFINSDLEHLSRSHHQCCNEFSVVAGIWSGIPPTLLIPVESGQPWRQRVLSH